MANIKYIVVTLLISAVLLGIIALWMGNKTGEITLLKDQTATLNESLPGPVTAVEEFGTSTITQTTNFDTAMDNAPTGKNPTVVFHTTKGDITMELFRDAMPITVDNFLKLIGEGYYAGTKFHRVIEGFMIQGGDSNSKGDNVATYGQGGPGYTIKDEFVADPRLSNVRGTIAMANTGQPNSGGSQFFINLADNVNLDFNKEPFASKHPVFGKVISGMNIVDVIGTTKVGARDLPVEPVIITTIEVK